MTVADELVVRDVLARHEKTLVSAILDGWEEWRALGLGGRLLFIPRSRACLVYDFIAKNAVNALDGQAGVHILCKDETVKILFDDRVVLRFKKASDNGLGSNIETQATMDFVDQQLALPGMPNAHKVEVVYILNHLRTQISQIAVVARDGDKCLWSYLLPIESDTAVIDLPRPVEPLLPVAPRVKLRVAHKDQKKETGN